MEVPCDLGGDSHLWSEQLVRVGNVTVKFSSYISLLSPRRKTPPRIQGSLQTGLASVQAQAGT